MKLPNVNLKTPCCGELYWVKGLVDEAGYVKELSGNSERSATIRYLIDSEQGKQLQKTIDEFWEEFRKQNPKTKPKPKSTCLKPVLDEDGEETDYIELKVKTNAFYKNGKPNWVPIYNAKGQNVTETFVEKNILIGNGSTGILHYTLVIYEYAKQFGITAYLRGIQIAKLIEYNEGATAEDLTDEGFVDENEAFITPDGSETPITPEI